jgi:hypothetical protein
MSLKISSPSLVLSLAASVVAGALMASVPNVCAADRPTETLTAAGTATTPFTTALMKNFDRWDVNTDGILSADEIDRAVADPASRGDDGAAAGTLKLLSRSSKLADTRLTRAYFADYAERAAKIRPSTRPSAASAEDATTLAGATGTIAASSAAVPVNWDVYFSASQRRIDRGKGPAWPKEFTLDDMHQGPLGDCFFIATVGSMVARDPARLHQMVKPLPNGGYEVTFPNAQPIRLAQLTDAQLAISSTTESSGPWLAVVEQAFGRYRSVVKGGSADVEGTDILRKGGDSAPTISHLTGHATRRIRFPRTAEERERRANEDLPTLRQAILENLRERRLITAGILPPSSATTRPSTQPTDGPAASLPQIPPGILKRHVYAVVGYDAATDVVEIWNPHGQTFTPKGPPGLQNGYITVDGRFKLPLGEAYRFYTSFTFESAEPAKTMP